MMCSSCDRFTLAIFPDDGEPLFGTEDAAKRAGLTQAGGVLVGGYEDGKKFGKRALEEALPLVKVRGRSVVAGLQPTGKVCARFPQERRISAQLGCDEPVEGETAFVDKAVIFHGRISRPVSSVHALA